MKRLLLIIWLGLVGLQIWSTNIGAAYSLTPAEKDFQVTRMNIYPRQAAKMGYLLEVKQEGQIINRVIDNFFTAIDLNEYFGQRLPVLLFFPFLLGLYFVVWEKRWRMVLIMFLISIGVMSLIGPLGKYGPILVLTFIWGFVAIGLGKVIRIL